MFLFPFLKYFKPHRRRIIIAIFCMFLVGALSTAPLFIAREAMQILTAGGFAKGQEPDGLPGSLTKLGGIENIESKTAGDGEKEALIFEKADTGLKQTINGLYKSSGEWLDARARPMREWYQERVKAEPLQALAFLSALLILAMLIKGLAEFTSKYELAYTFFHTNLQMREDIYGNILRQDYLYFNDHSPGYLHSRINSDVKSVRNVLEGLLSDGIQQPITILFMFAFLLYLNAKLTLGVIVFLPIVAGLLYYFAKVIRKNTRKQKRKEDELSASLTESLNNIRLVKAFGTEGLEVEKYHKRTLALFRYMMARRTAKFGASPLMEFLGSVAGSGVLLFGGWMIINGSTNFGDFLLYLYTMTRFYRPLRSLAVVNNKYQEASIGGERMSQMLALKPQLKEHPNPKPFRQLERAVEFRGIGFRYKNKEILKNITMTVEAGQRVALAGPSGGGKTTLVNMLARLFDPTEGNILIDGVDLREINLADWREHLAIVTQDTYLFDDTVENNIAYGLGAVDPERARAAARAANAHEFIMQLDGGKDYKTMLGPGGGRLSGGQRQRLAIARAIYRDPKILILDEATSALDAHSQAVVQEALNRLMTGRTTFVIAHRISTIRDVDCIYVIDGGHIAEQGSHDELMARGGIYHSMATKVGLLPEDVVGDSSLMSIRGPAEEWPAEEALEL